MVGKGLLREGNEKNSPERRLKRWKRQQWIKGWAGCQHNLWCTHTQLMNGLETLSLSATEIRSILFYLILLSIIYQTKTLLNAINARLIQQAAVLQCTNYTMSTLFIYIFLFIFSGKTHWEAHSLLHSVTRWHLEASQYNHSLNHWNSCG